MNVAVVKTGPDVTWPTAIASSNCRSVNQPFRSTRSARRKASSTYPEPNRTEPTLRKNKNNGQRPTGAAEAATVKGNGAAIPRNEADSGGPRRTRIARYNAGSNPAPNRTINS